MNMCASSELAETRVELAWLEKQEQELLQKLFHVRAAIRVQKTKLDELMPAPIDRLPNELLVRILKLSIHESCLELAGVSRRWRDVVLHSPSLWTTIRVTKSMSLLKLKTHVSKSSELPLDIEIQLWTEPLLNTVLDVLIPCAHRWRSLVIQCSGCSLIKNMLTTMGCTAYPSLTHLSIRNIGGSSLSMISQFHSGSFPCLEHLELKGSAEKSSVFEAPAGVTSLSLGLWGIDLLSTLQHSSLQKLTSLFISQWESGRGMQLKPDSIHFPLLETFVYETGLSVLIQAISAPKLAYFEYGSIIDCEIFETRAPKFPNVVRLVLGGVRSGHPTGSALAVPFAFPAARHIDLLDSAEFLFSPERGPISAVHWPQLESLTIRDIEIWSLGFLDGLVPWLKARRDMDTPMLLVRFAFHNLARREDGVLTALPEAGSMVTILYEALHGLCRLEWVDVLLAGIVLSGTQNESLRLEMPNVYPNFIDDIGTAIIQRRNIRSSAGPSHKSRWAYKHGYHSVVTIGL